MSDTAPAMTPWWAWIPLVGPVANFIYQGIKYNESQTALASDAIDTAATTQADAVTEAQTGINTATATAQGMLSPYSEAGKAALTRQQALLGLGGPEAQKSAIDSIAQGPEMAALSSQGENAILQGAAATGGLRGGNVQGALAQFRPQLLSNLISQQYQNLGGLANTGYNAAAQSGATAIGGAQSSGDLAQSLAAIQAGQTLSQQQLAAQNQINPLDLALKFAGYAAGGGF